MYTLAVVKSADSGTIREPVLDVMCSLYPNIHPLVWLNPHLASVSMPEWGTSPFFIDDLCHTRPPLAFSNVLSGATMKGSTIPSSANIFPIAAILCLTSDGIVFRRLSNVRLSGMDFRPQAAVNFLLYTLSDTRNSCSALFESILNHIRTMKHRSITVGE